MVKFLMLFIALSCSEWSDHKADCFNGCGKPKDGANGMSCSAIETTDEVIIACENGTKSVILKPKDAPPGEKGASGTSCTVDQTDFGSTVICDDGTMGEILNGSTGPAGQNGADGAPGADGSSCTSIPYINGAVVQCDDGSSVVILNGTDGQDGQDGADGQDGQDAPPTPFVITELIRPCPLLPGTFREVLLRLGDGSLMAHFAGGGNQFLTTIPPGNYQLTDGSGCDFSVDSDLTVTDEYNNVWEVSE